MTLLSVCFNTSVLLSGNHKLTATAKVIVKICEHEVGIDGLGEKHFFMSMLIF